MSKYNILDIPCVWRKKQENLTARELRDFMQGASEAAKHRQLAVWALEKDMSADSIRRLVNIHGATEFMSDKELEQHAIKQFKLPKVSTALRLDKEVTDWLKAEYGLEVKPRTMTNPERKKCLGERERLEASPWLAINRMPILAA